MAAPPEEPPQPSFRARLGALLHRIHVTKNPAAWAVIGASAGVVVTGTVSIITANIAADTSVKTADIARQVAQDGTKAAAAQSETDFIRTQRLTEYTNYLVKVTKLEAAMNVYAIAVQKRDPPVSHDLLNKTYADFQDSWSAYVDSSWRVHEVASDSVEVARDSLDSFLSENVSAKLLLGPGDYNINPQDVAKAMEPIQAKFDDLKNNVGMQMRAAFVEGQ